MIIEPIDALKAMMDGGSPTIRETIIDAKRSCLVVSEAKGAFELWAPAWFYTAIRALGVSTILGMRVFSNSVRPDLQGDCELHAHLRFVVVAADRGFTRTAKETS